MVGMNTPFPRPNSSAFPAKLDQPHIRLEKGMSSYVGSVRTIVALATAVAMTACESATEPRFDGPPPLPPAGSMSADFSFFVGKESLNPGAHFVAASQLISTAQVSTTSLIELPRVVYLAGQAIAPVSQNDGYHRSYVATADPITFDASLVGRARGITDAVWEMRVTSGGTAPPVNGFLWITGTSLLNQFEGTWRIFDLSLPATRTEVLNVIWQNYGSSSWRVIFRNARQGTAEEDDYIEYESSFDLFRATFADASTGLLHTIEWNTVTFEGYILSPSYNGGAKSCWNSALINTPCLI
jgi:hypothetical protein